MQENGGCYVKKKQTKKKAKQTNRPSAPTQSITNQWTGSNTPLLTRHQTNSTTTPRNRASACEESLSTSSEVPLQHSPSSVPAANLVVPSPGSPRALAGTRHLCISQASTPPHIQPEHISDAPYLSAPTQSITNQWTGSNTPLLTRHHSNSTTTPRNRASACEESPRTSSEVPLLHSLSSVPAANLVVPSPGSPRALAGTRHLCISQASTPTHIQPEHISDAPYLSAPTRSITNRWTGINTSLPTRRHGNSTTSRNRAPTSEETLVLQWNVCGANPRRTELQQLISRYDPVAIAIQELRTPNLNGYLTG
ncbi:mucin-2-like isoform X2 [Uranotaenia lowii]|uniref:mucin-2-like isoform X2 n=1 Tax=Uranotaenia lowii TaxID=190385 RepID=UPI00247857B8|nr:mucin-2-like isoform X2 [Uranotaenia lowii]